jgi:hypothetical protein
LKAGLMTLYLKSPTRPLDYSIVWPLGLRGPATVAESCWQIRPDEPQGLAITAQSRSDAQVSVTVDGGRDGHVYALEHVARFSDGRIEQRSIQLRVEG